LDDLAHARRDSLRRAVRRTYAQAATVAAAAVPGRRGAVCCTPHSGLGCGSPTVFAGLSPGEWVLDLGSGAGFDCLAAAVEVGSAGRVVGIDMTSEMVRLASRHAADAGVAIASFLQGEIERLPFRNATFDVVMSNCVINLCADKDRIFAEACRVLKPNGRLAVADIVAVAPLPPSVLADLALHAGCISGAAQLQDLSRLLREAGFASEEIDIGEHSRSLLDAWAPDLDLDRFVVAANITARKQTDVVSTALLKVPDEHEDSRTQG
jgi:SAM-dependent methyltransferase